MSSPSYFTRRFVKEFGQLPSEYRKKMRNSNSLDVEDHV